MSTTGPASALLIFCAWLAGAPDDALTAELKKETLQSFERYIRGVEARRDEQLRKNNFLWADDSADRVSLMRAGRVVAEQLNRNEMKVKDGLIHDWIGAAFIPNTTLAKALALVQDYDNHKTIYQPEVIGSKILSHNGQDFKIFLRLRKKKVVTVVLNTEHDVRYFPLDSKRCHSRSYSTRIAQVDNYGEKNEREKPVDTGSGFLWRLYSYWRFQEKDGGVYIECQAISLTRDIPFGFGWVAMPIVRDLPRESLENTLRATRNALNKQEVGGVRALR